MVEMELRELQISHVTPHQIVILEEKAGERTFPIFIGYFEAEAADQAVRGRKHPRPLTHDLVLNVVEGLGASIEGVLVDQLANDTFYGKLLLRTKDGKHVKIDSRPSDAIVLAVKAKVPIYVNEEVLEQVSGADEE